MQLRIILLHPSTDIFLISVLLMLLANIFILDQTCARAFRIGFRTEVESKTFDSAFEHWKQQLIGEKTGMLFSLSYYFE